MIDVSALAPWTWTDHGAAFVAVGSFVWGLGSALLSPCHLGIIPLLGTHAAGYSPFTPRSGSGRDEAETGGAAPRLHAVRRTLLFTLGCFVTIPLFGLLFALLGHGLEMSGHWWTIPVGALLIWFGADMFRDHSCAHAAHIWGTLRRRLGIGEDSGAFVLGFGYGLLASGCTVGFLVPLLVVTLAHCPLWCMFFAACFGLGHILPMVVVGCSVPLARRLLHGRHEPHAHDPEGRCVTHTEARTGCLDDPHAGEALFRRIMGVVIGLIGIAFILHPFLE